MSLLDDLFSFYYTFLIEKLKAMCLCGLFFYQYKLKIIIIPYRVENRK
jgi:hypothetical protein